MRPNELMSSAAATLTKANISSAPAQVRTLLAHVCQVEPGQLHQIDNLNDDQINRFNALIERRLAGEPVQYLTGTAWFRYTKVEVGPGVFIPRPETETVVGWAIDRIKTKPGPVVVDLGTGSGVIAKAIAEEVPHAEVYAVEKDPDAYSYAQKNLSDTKVNLVQGDFVDSFTELDGKVDLVISNPPYISAAELAKVGPEVLNSDPIQALASGEDGLDHIRLIKKVAKRLLCPGGLVVVEHGEDQHSSAPEVFREEFIEVEDHNDLTNRPRFVSAKLAGQTKTGYQVFAVETQTQEAIQTAGQAIKAGNCIVLPTDTVYGIGACATDAGAVQSLLNAKHRGRDMPPPVLISEPAMLAALAGTIPQGCKKLAEHFWPGALTVIVVAQKSLNMDLGDTAGTIAVRVPDNDFTRELLRHTGPLAVSSANISGKPAATSISEAIEMLGESVGVYLDGGVTESRVASSIVDYSVAGNPKLVRAGQISLAELQKIDPDISELKPDSGAKEVQEEPSSANLASIKTSSEGNSANA